MLLESEDDALVAAAEYAQSPGAPSSAAPKTKKAWIGSVAEASQLTAGGGAAAMAAPGQPPAYVAGEAGSLMLLQLKPGGISCEFLLQPAELEPVYNHVLQCYARVLVGEACRPPPADQHKSRKRVDPGAVAAAALDGELAELLGSLPHYHEQARQLTVDTFFGPVPCSFRRFLSLSPPSHAVWGIVLRCVLPSYADWCSKFDVPTNLGPQAVAVLQAQAADMHATSTLGVAAQASLTRPCTTHTDVAAEAATDEADSAARFDALLLREQSGLDSPVKADAAAVLRTFIRGHHAFLRLHNTAGSASVDAPDDLLHDCDFRLAATTPSSSLQTHARPKRGAKHAQTTPAEPKPAVPVPATATVDACDTAEFLARLRRSTRGDAPASPGSGKRKRVSARGGGGGGDALYERVKLFVPAGQMQEFGSGVGRTTNAADRALQMDTGVRRRAKANRRPVVPLTTVSVTYETLVARVSFQDDPAPQQQPARYKDFDMISLRSSALASANTIAFGTHRVLFYVTQFER